MLRGSLQHMLQGHEPTAAPGRMFLAAQRATGALQAPMKGRKGVAHLEGRALWHWHSAWAAPHQHMEPQQPSLCPTTAPRTTAAPLRGWAKAFTQALKELLLPALPLRAARLLLLAVAGTAAVGML